MKYILVFFIVIGASYADLHKDFIDIVNVIPVDKIEAIAKEHSKNDPEYQEVVAYMNGTEWKNMVNEIYQQEIYQKLEEFLYQIGLDIQKIYWFLEQLIDGIFHPKHSKMNLRMVANEKESLRSFLDEVETAIPKQKVLAIILDKLQTSKDFQKFFNQISSRESKALVEQTRKSSAIIKLVQKLERMEVKVQDGIDYVYTLFGWSFYGM